MDSNNPAQATPENTPGYTEDRAEYYRAQIRRQPSLHDAYGLIQVYQKHNHQRLLALEAALHDRSAGGQNHPPFPHFPLESRSGYSCQLHGPHCSRVAVRQIHWKTEDVGYFVPEAPDDSVWNEGSKLYFEDVYDFVERMRDVTRFKGEDTVKANIYNCLRGEALDWFTTELTAAEKDRLHNSSLEDGWFPALVERFRSQSDEAKRMLRDMYYGLHEIKQGCDPRDFVQEYLHHARTAGIHDLATQLTFAWEHLTGPLRLGIPQPTHRTTLTEFLEQLEQKYETWKDLAASL